MRKCKILIITFAVISILFFAGCSNKSMSIDMKNKISSIEISEDILSPKYPLFMVSGIIHSSAESEKQNKRLYTYFKRNNIDIKEIYQEELEKALESHNYFQGKIVENGKYVLTSSILVYGLIYHPNIFSDNYKPVIIVKIDLKSKQTKELIWSDSTYISNLNGSSASKLFHEYINNPEGFKKALAEIAQMAIEETLSEI